MTARFARIAIAVLCLGLSSATISATSVPGADFFTNGALHDFQIELSTENVRSLRVEPRRYVPATVLANGKTYTNVGVHLKGVATFRPIDDEPSLTLHFSKFIRDQRFHGLRKVHLNNGKEDPTFLCEALSAQTFAKAGLPTPRVTHARTRLNGRDLGPYVAIEGFTEEFLARYFKKTGGNLYDSGFRHDITYPLERLSGRKPEWRQDLDELAAAARTDDLDERWTKLAQCLDTNAFARYLAMQVLIANWDGYALYKNNYRIYHDPESHRLHFMPHGMDQTFARPTYVLLPPRWDGMVARAFMETPPGRALYCQQLPLLFTNVYDAELLVERAKEMAALVRPLLDEGATAAYDRQVTMLCLRIAQRGNFITRQLSTTNWMNPLRRYPTRQPIVTQPEQ